MATKTNTPAININEEGIASRMIEFGIAPAPELTAEEKREFKPSDAEKELFYAEENRKRSLIMSDILFL